MELIITLGAAIFILAIVVTVQFTIIMVYRGSTKELEGQLETAKSDLTDLQIELRLVKEGRDQNTEFTGLLLKIFEKEIHNQNKELDLNQKQK